MIKFSIFSIFVYTVFSVFFCLDLSPFSTKQRQNQPNLSPCEPFLSSFAVQTQTQSCSKDLEFSEMFITLARIPNTFLNSWLLNLFKAQRDLLVKDPDLKHGGRAEDPWTLFKRQHKTPSESNTFH